MTDCKKRQLPAVSVLVSQRSKISVLDTKWDNKALRCLWLGSWAQVFNCWLKSMFDPGSLSKFSQIYLSALGYFFFKMRFRENTRGQFQLLLLFDCFSLYTKQSKKEIYCHGKFMPLFMTTSLSSIKRASFLFSLLFFFLFLHHHEIHCRWENFQRHYLLWATPTLHRRYNTFTEIYSIARDLPSFKFIQVLQNFLECIALWLTSCHPTYPICQCSHCGGCCHS